MKKNDKLKRQMTEIFGLLLLNHLVKRGVTLAFDWCL